MNPNANFRRIAILGAGLIGASFGAAVETVQPGTSIIAFDRAEVLEKLRASKFKWECTADVGHAVRKAELVYIALPAVAAAEVLSEISLHCAPNTLVTDVSSTKGAICKAARAFFGHGAIFVGGHPIAGRELAGFEHASAELFRGKRYALISDCGREITEDSHVQRFVDLLRSIGAEPLWISAEAHDRAMAALSQMPQLVAIALAEAIFCETKNGAPLSLAGSGLRDMLRTAGSPYEIWRDICKTNRENIAHSLDRIGQAIHFLREHLTSSELEMRFRDANELHEMLNRAAIGSAGSSPVVDRAANKVGVDG